MCVVEVPTRYCLDVFFPQYIGLYRRIVISKIIAITHNFYRHISNENSFKTLNLTKRKVYTTLPLYTIQFDYFSEHGIEF